MPHVRRVVRHVLIQPHHARASEVGILGKQGETGVPRQFVIGVVADSERQPELGAIELLEYGPQRRLPAGEIGLQRLAVVERGHRNAMRA